MLLHCHISPEKHPRFDSPVVKSAIREMSEAELISPDLGNPLSGIYHTTDKGAAHVRQLCDLPFPTAKWVGFDGKPLEA